MADERGAQPDADAQGAWGRPVPARAGEIVVAAALLAVAVFFVSQAALLDFGRVGLPGPGFFPFVLGIALGLVSLMILFVTGQSPGAGEAVFLGHRDVLVALAALGGVAFMFEQADTYLVLGAFVACLLLVVARTTLWRALLGASLGMVLVWAVFKVALGVRLPAGRYWDDLAARFAGSLPTGLF